MLSPRISRSTIFLPFLLVTVALTGCPGRRTSSSSQPVRVGALLALTGSGANYGKSLQNGIQLAVDEINRGGGINGQPVQIVYEDSQGDAKTGITAFNRLSSVDRVPVVIGSISSVILAVAPLADRQHVVLINSSAISPKISTAAGNYLFSLMPSGADEARYIVPVLKGRGIQRVALIYSNNASGVGTRDAFVPTAQAAGLTVVDQEPYDLTATDYRVQLAKMKAAKPDALYLLAFSSKEFASILRQAKQLGISTPWYTYSGFETDETIRLAGSAASGVVYSYPKYTGNRAAMAAFQKAYREKHGAGADIYTVTSYDGVKMLARALASGATADKIRNALRTDSGYQGVFGPIKLDSKQCIQRPFMLKTVANQSFVEVPTTR